MHSALKWTEKKRKTCSHLYIYRYNIVFNVNFTGFQLTKIVNRIDDDAEAHMYDDVGHLSIWQISNFDFINFLSENWVNRETHAAQAQSQSHRIQFAEHRNLIFHFIAFFTNHHLIGRPAFCRAFQEQKKKMVAIVSSCCWNGGKENILIRYICQCYSHLYFRI